MSELYTDESGVIQADADGLIHPAGCGPPACCGDAQYLKAVQCADGVTEIYILKDALCTNVGGGVQASTTAVLYDEECYLVEVSPAYDPGDIPGGATVLEDSGFECDRSGCTGELCADLYVEFRNCGPSTTFTDAQRVFVPYEDFQLWVEASTNSDRNFCCNVWRINGRCVVRPVVTSGFTTHEPPAASFIATGGPDAYAPQYTSCCECSTTCTKEDRSCDYGTSQGVRTAVGCARASSLQTIRHSHTISYTRFDETVTEDFVGSGSGTVTGFDGACSGTNVWRSNASNTLLTAGVTATGSCKGSGSGGSPCTPLPPVSEFRDTAGDDPILPTDVLLVGSGRHAVPVFLVSQPSFSYHGTVNYRTSSSSPFFVDRLDVEWTCVIVHSCEYYSQTYTCTLTHVVEQRFGSYTGSVLERKTQTLTLTATFEGFIVCAVGSSNVACCICPEEEMLLMAGPPPGDGPEAGGLSGRITRASGATRLAGFVRRRG